MTAMPLDLEVPPAPSDEVHWAAIAKREWAALRNWALVWVVLANIAFAPMWFIGAPPRHTEIVIAGIIGLLVRSKPAWLQMVAFAGVMTFSVLGFIAGIFNLSLMSLLSSLQFLMEIKPAQSLEYIAGAGLILCVFVGAWFAIRRPSNFTNWRMTLIAAAATLSVALLDLWMGQGMRGHYQQAPAAGAPFESAMLASGAERNAIAGNRNLVIIIVESMGVPVSNKEMQGLLFKGLDTPAMEKRFASSRGTSLYYHSTTAAEVRELCGRWGDYHEILEAGGDSSCLPARMKKSGYQTHAMHSFEGFFFDREDWYPGLGFDTQRFSKDLQAAGAEFCGGVFAGACDRDIPAQLAQQLKSQTGPQLVYWLTLNSHLPVPEGGNLELEQCTEFSPELADEFPMICRQFMLWSQLETALVKEITAADLPPTDFLLVGDHMPPYFQRTHRRQFAPDRVPYLYLQWRDDATEQAQ
ncbi:MAG: sulfatase-like hydrolase/transferase [Marinomonas sp.]